MRDVVEPVRAWEETISLQTYVAAPADPNPMFLEKRVYQGSSGKVYPNPFTDRISKERAERSYRAIHLENEYVRLMILPEIGGRIHVGQDKTNGYDFFYRQNVIKPALVGLLGPWISGGVEFNWPQHHRPSTFMPVHAAGKLPLVLHLRVSTEGALSATLDSPSQGAMGLPCTDVKLSSETLDFTVPVVQGAYGGTLSADGRTLTGSWQQAGQSMPLVFHQTTTAGELAAVKPSPVDRDWEGALRAGNVTLRLVFHLHAQLSGAIAGTLDSIDQGAMGIACAQVNLKGRNLTLTVPTVHGMYQGTLSESGKSIRGTWSQGQPLELDLTRMKGEASQPPRMLPARPPLALQDLPGVLGQEFAPLVQAWPQGGVVVGVLNHGLREVMAFGSAEADSIFEIGSITKTFTALALAQMVVQKKVTLDQPVRELLPAGWVVKPDGPEISLLDLATHRSGLPRLPDNMKPANLADPYADYGPEQLRAYLSEHGVGRPEQPEFLYSNLGVGLLGFALAQKAGMPYEELIQKEVTGPMGLKDTVIALSPAQQKRFLQGYQGAHDLAEPWSQNALAGAGGLRSTAADLLTYCDLLLHREHTRAGKETGAEATLSRAISMVLEPQANVDPGGMVKVALAWLVRPGEDKYFHDGGTGGYSSLVIFQPKKDRAIVVLYNCQDMMPGRLQLVDRVGANVLALLDGKRTQSLD